MLYAIEMFNPQFNKIVDNIYIGNYIISFSRQFLYEKKIKLIINCTSELENTYKSDKTFNYYRIPISDASIDINYNLEIIIDKIRKYYLHHENILIFCYDGISSSYTVIIAYLMKYYKMSLDDSIKYMSSNHDILANIRNILLSFETYLKNKI